MTNQRFTVSTKVPVDLVLARFDSEQSAFCVMASFFGSCSNTELTNATQGISNFTLQGKHLFEQKWRELPLGECFKCPLYLKQALFANCSTTRPRIAHLFYYISKSMLYVVTEPKRCLSKFDFARQLFDFLCLVRLTSLISGKREAANNRCDGANCLYPASPFRRVQAGKPTG